MSDDIDDDLAAHLAGDDRQAAGRGDEGKVPPHDLDAEAAVLSCAIADAERLLSIPYLRAPHFFSEAHRRIFEAVLWLRDAGEKVDLVTVGARLKDVQRLAQVGGVPYLAQLCESHGVIANLDAYARIVHDRCRLRDVILACQQIASRGHAPDVGDVQTFIDTATKEVAKIAMASPRSNNEPAWAAMRRLVEMMAAASRIQTPTGGSSNRTPGIPTGIPRLDRESLGMGLGKKITIMAERGRGKTSLALQIGMHAAGWRGRSTPVAEKRVAVKFFSTEMTKRELAIKQLALAARIDSKRIEASLSQATLTQQEWDRVYEALPRLDQLRLLIDDRGNVTIDDVVDATLQERAICEKVHGLQLAVVVVDYVQRLQAPKRLRNPTEKERIDDATMRLKNLAKDEGLVVIELAQMNTPDPKISKSGKPYENLAYGTKTIEKESNDVYALWRKNGRNDTRNIGLECTKLRGGAEFEMDLIFEPEFGIFTDAEYAGFQQPIDLWDGDQ